jgi:hypothetical protein
MGFSKEGNIAPGQGRPPEKSSGWQPCQVETYSGYRVHERPRRFTLDGEWLEVRRVLSRWREPENLCFTVTAHDSCDYLLKYHLLRNAWEIRIWRAFG